jgi:acetolactate synthase-1/2/3 large subunit
VARALKTEDVEAIFTLCEGHIIDIDDGCLDEGIKIIDVRHEQAAAHTADAWTRVTGKPGVAVVTAGPGTTDTVTGVANAFRAQTPMLVIGGQGASTPACRVRRIFRLAYRFSPSHYCPEHIPMAGDDDRVMGAP